MRRDQLEHAIRTACTGSPFAAGHRLDPGGPITGASDTRLTAVAFATDPQLPAIDTPHGRVEFLTVVGITAGELARMKKTRTATVIAELPSASPLLVTDPNRSGDDEQPGLRHRFRR